MRRDQGEVGNDWSGLEAAGGGVKLAPAGDIVEEGKGEQADEADARGRGDIDTERHVGTRRPRRGGMRTSTLGDFVRSGNRCWGFSAEAVRCIQRAWLAVVSTTSSISMYGGHNYRGYYP